MRFVGVRVCVAYSRSKLALRTRLRNLNLKSQFSILNSFRDIRVYIYDFWKFVGVIVCVFSYFVICYFCKCFEAMVFRAIRHQKQ